jgi:uridine kinase
MSIANRILRVQLRNGALTNFDPDRTRGALLAAAQSIGGFGHDLEDSEPYVLFAGRADEEVAQILADMVVMALNSDPRHHIPNFPPHIEHVQDMIVHVLRSFGFVDVADVYEAYRWGKHWIRTGDLAPAEFVANGFPEERCRRILKRNTEWGCDTVAGANEIVASGRALAILERSFAEYEAELDAVAAAFEARVARGHRIQIIVVAGPSSSGKTTTTVKLHQRLTARGVPLVMMNLDHYFWPAHQHPVDWMADRDYETPHALDYQLINRHLHELLSGRPVDMPAYDFKLGDRVPGSRLALPSGACLLLDCLHGLYPPLTRGIPDESKFRIYLENLNMVYEGLGSTRRTVRFADVRMLRRMLRDHRHRNHNPVLTLVHWDKVRRSELANIVPFWKHADVVVNGGTPLDLAILKPFIEGVFPAEEALGRYPGHLDARLRRQRAARLIASSASLPADQLARIPGDSLVREFIGGSTLSIPHND